VKCANNSSISGNESELELTFKQLAPAPLELHKEQSSGSSSSKKAWLRLQSPGSKPLTKAWKLLKRVKKNQSHEKCNHYYQNERHQW